MNNRTLMTLAALSLIAVANLACRESTSHSVDQATSKEPSTAGESVVMSDSAEQPASGTKSADQWKKELSPEEFRVLRQCGTEPPFTGKYWDHHEKGMYYCAGCDKPLFSSETKFDSGSGWPSFWNPATNDALKARVDESHGMVRTEILCAGCGGHLGHVFKDGPEPTGLRYCINSAALEFRADKSE